MNDFFVNRSTLDPQRMLLSWDGGESKSPVQEASSATDTDTNSQEDPGQQCLSLTWSLYRYGVCQHIHPQSGLATPIRWFCFRFHSFKMQSLSTFQYVGHWSRSLGYKIDKNVVPSF